MPDKILIAYITALYSSHGLAIVRPGVMGSFAWPDRECNPVPGVTIVTIQNNGLYLSGPEAPGNSHHYWWCSDPLELTIRKKTKP